METNKVNNLRKNKKGVFGLSAIQTFFVMLLGIALIAYVIVIIMGSLQTSTVLTPAQDSVTNETVAWLNQSGYQVVTAGATGFTGPTLTTIWAAYPNASAGYNYSITLANATIISNGIIRNTTTVFNSSVMNNLSISYTYTRNSAAQNQTNNLLGNVSGGVTGFFSNITPVFAILAVLVIILVLVVLIRVVQAPQGGQGTPQL